MPPTIVIRHLTKLFANSKLTVSVVFESVTYRGIFDDMQIVAGESGFDQDRDLKDVLLLAADAERIPQYAHITVDGQHVEVRKKLRVEDGALRRLVLAEVTT